MNWFSLTKKQQQMVIVTVILAVAQILLMVHFLGWLTPAAARGGSVKKELLDLQSKIEDARDVLRRKEPIERSLIASIEELENLTSHTPTLSDRYAWSYEYVSRCARQSQVELDSLEEVVFPADAQADKKKPIEQPYEIKVSTRCGYNNLVQFLWRLEKDNPLLRIKEVAVASVGDQPAVQQVQIVMQWPVSVKIERGQ
ncbi:MAG: hypothetical protein IT583_06930 [Verrucomicrobia bacterium]|nr:hypothetical protein [Verrucomicrobiota bacterium]